jgi:hypothetical protein
MTTGVRSGIKIAIFIGLNVIYSIELRQDGTNTGAPVGQPRKEMLAEVKAILKANYEGMEAKMDAWIEEQRPGYENSRPQIWSRIQSKQRPQWNLLEHWKTDMRTGI